MAKPIEEMTTDEKLNEILKYQRSARHWAIVRGIMSFLVFFIFIVLPIIASFYLFDYITNNVDLGSMKEQYQDVLGGLGKFNEESKQLDGIDIDSLLNQIGQ